MLQCGYEPLESIRTTINHININMHLEYKSSPISLNTHSCGVLSLIGSTRVPSGVLSSSQMFVQAAKIKERSSLQVLGGGKGKSVTSERHRLLAA